MFARKTTQRADLPHSTTSPATGNTNSKSKSKSKSRIAELDGLRGLAALAIVLFHTSPSRLPMGWAAVDLFFVLSGYLITTIILRQGDSPRFLARFFIRRGLRIWPIYYLTLLLILALGLGPGLPRPIDLSGLPYDLLYLQKIPRYWTDQAQNFSPYLAHTWTLAIEEQFYLVWPVLLLWTRRKGVIPLALGALAISLTLRAGGWPVFLLGTRADGLALGALLAAFLDDSKGSPPISPVLLRKFLWVALGTSILGLGWVAQVAGLGLPAGPPPWPALSIFLINLCWFGVVGLVVLGAGKPGLAGLRGRRLGYLGRISYGLYLYHLPILGLSGDYARALGLSGQPFWREGPTLALCFLLAALSWHYVERPILAFKDRFDDPSGSDKNANANASRIEPLANRRAG